MAKRPVWYDAADVRKAFWIWLVLFAILVAGNLYTARQDRGSSVPVLNGMSLFLLLPYWVACLAYSLLLFGRLRDGQRFSVFPVFIGLQLVLIVAEQGRGFFDFLEETWKDDSYLFVPFGYSLIVYIITLVLRNRLRLYDADTYRDMMM